MLASVCHGPLERRRVAATAPISVLAAATRQLLDGSGLPAVRVVHVTQGRQITYELQAAAGRAKATRGHPIEHHRPKTSFQVLVGLAAHHGRRP